MPSVERHDLNPLHIVLTVSLSKDDYFPKLEADLRKMRQRAQIKGFRAGQTPMPVIKKMYGQSAMVEAINELTVKHLYGYIQEHKIATLFQPLPVENETRYRFDINSPEDFEFKFDVGLEPEWELNGLTTDSIFHKKTIADLDELASRDFESARRRMAARTNPTDDIKDEDIVKIEARELNADGSPKADGLETTMTTFLKNVSAGSLRDLLLSKKTGDVIQFNPRELDSFGSEEMFRKYMLGLDGGDGREVNDLFEGTIGEVSRLELPEINQEFYDKYFGPDQVVNHEDAVQRLREAASRHYDTQAEGLLMRDFQEKLLVENQFDLPEIFLKRWLMTQLKEKRTTEEVEFAWPAFANNLRWTIIRERLQREFGYEITEADLRAEFGRRIAGYFGGNLDMMPPGILDSTVNKLMADEKQVKEVEQEIEFNKLFEGIRERVTIQETPISSAEFNSILAEIQAQSKADRGFADELADDFEN